MPFLDNSYVAFALISVSVFSLYMGAVALFRKNPMRERIKRVMPVDLPGVGYAYEQSKSPIYTLCSRLLAGLGIDLSAAKRDLYLPLARAGMMSEESVVYFVFFRRCVQPVLLFFSVVVLMRISTLEEGAPTSQILSHVIFSAMLAVAGFQGARIYINNRITKRAAILQRSFPDALDLLLVCVEAGLPMDSALARVCREMKRSHPAITEELDRTRIELGVLGDRVQAWQNLAERTNTPGFKTFVSSLVQTEKVGSSISDTLRMLSDEYRTARMLQAENKAARIPALITVPLIFFIMPSFMLIIMGPPIVRIMEGGGLFPDTSHNSNYTP